MYAEMGGQVADHGGFHLDGAGSFAIEDVQRAGQYVLHIGRVNHGRIKCSAHGQLMITRERRESIRANHSATHAMNLALRAVAGDEVEQKGSLVDGDKLRFDYAAKTRFRLSRSRKSSDE